MMVEKKKKSCSESVEKAEMLVAEQFQLTYSDLMLLPAIRWQETKSKKSVGIWTPTKTRAGLVGPPC